MRVPGSAHLARAGRGGPDAVGIPRVRRRPWRLLPTLAELRAESAHLLRKARQLVATSRHLQALSQVLLARLGTRRPAPQHVQGAVALAIGWPAPTRGRAAKGGCVASALIVPLGGTTDAVGGRAEGDEPMMEHDPDLQCLGALNAEL